MNRIYPILREALLIALVGMLAGLAVNHRLVLDAFAGRLTGSLPVAAPTNPPLPQPVLLEEVRELAAAGAVLVDARDTPLFAGGHLPGAASLPLGEFEARLDDFQRQVTATRTIIIYCNGYGCEDSFDLGLRLLAAGYQDVRVFEGGFPEWRDAGLPVATEGQ